MRRAQTWLIGIVLYAGQVCLTGCTQGVECVHDPLTQIRTTPIASFEGHWHYHTEIFEVDPHIAHFVRQMHPIEVTWEVAEEELTVMHDHTPVLSFRIERQLLSGHFPGGGLCRSVEDYPPDLLWIDWWIDDTANQATLPFESEWLVESVPLFFSGSNYDVLRDHSFETDGSILTEYLLCLLDDVSGRCTARGRIVVRHVFERID